ncbi:MAG: transcriptional regulator of arginine metabolism [Sphingomonadales bacterium]|jgi:transcriptional regulator of arginine metabolism|nr:transcriptional regulator of arginine metabolism [Sphingomonadales bacterium]MEA3050492.1 transcriptional regulator of arginine metabolism [Sphingomonadales bacterium]
MTESRLRRQRVIADLLRGGAIASQEEVTERLSAAGFAVTQATVSRDLDQLGAVKVKKGNMLRYVLPDEIGDTDWAAGRLGRILAQWVLSIEPAAPLLVLKTPPGSAHIVGVAFDQAKLAEVAGTICGDDTIFVALRDQVDAAAMARRLSRLTQDQS